MSEELNKNDLVEVTDNKDEKGLLDIIRNLKKENQELKRQLSSGEGGHSHAGSDGDKNRFRIGQKKKFGARGGMSGGCGNGGGMKGHDRGGCGNGMKGGERGGCGCESKHGEHGCGCDSKHGEHGCGCDSKHGEHGCGKH
ncbi:MAG: hypothetical protein J5934_07965 [Succinivibrio sp.]|nr:hypothetical protein [Succinivibrio sp.]